MLISPADYGRAGAGGSSDVRLCHLGILQAKAAGTMVQAPYPPVSELEFVLSCFRSGYSIMERCDLGLLGWGETLRSIVGGTDLE